MSRWADVASRRVEDRADQPGWFALRELPASTRRMRLRILAAALYMRSYGWLRYRNGRWRGPTTYERAVIEARNKRLVARSMKRWERVITRASYQKMQFVPRIS